MQPLLSSVDVQTAVLLEVGGVFYSIGAGFHPGGRCLSITQYGTASCWSRPAVITQLFCMGGVGPIVSRHRIVREIDLKIYALSIAVAASRPDRERAEYNVPDRV